MGERAGERWRPCVMAIPSPPPSPPPSPRSCLARRGSGQSRQPTWATSSRPSGRPKRRQAARTPRRLRTALRDAAHFPYEPMISSTAALTCCSSLSNRRRLSVSSTAVNFALSCATASRPIRSPSTGVGTRSTPFRRSSTSSEASARRTSKVRASTRPPKYSCCQSSRRYSKWGISERQSSTLPTSSASRTRFLTAMPSPKTMALLVQIQRLDLSPSRS